MLIIWLRIYFNRGFLICLTTIFLLNLYTIVIYFHIFFFFFLSLSLVFFLFKSNKYFSKLNYKAITINFAWGVVFYWNNNLIIITINYLTYLVDIIY